MLKKNDEDRDSRFLRMMKKFKETIKDEYGLMYSTELLLSIILLIFIIGTIANLSDDVNEKMLSEEELHSLESTAIETSEYLLNNPGSPENWEEDEGLESGIVSPRIIPGLAIKRKAMENGQFYDESTNEEEILSNSISYRKLKKIKSNYNELIERNLFNNSFKSSMAVYPLNSKIRPLEMGDEIDDSRDDRTIASIDRTVKCDFYSSFAVYEFNELELYGEDYEEGICNHDTNPDLTSHENDGRSVWLCKSFRVYKKSLEDYSYYLISDEDIGNCNVDWVLESLNRSSDEERRLNQEVIDLNPFFSESLENSSEDIYSIHFNVDRNHINDFKTVLVAIPKNMTDELIANNELKYDYFKENDVNFRFKIGYA